MAHHDAVENNPKKEILTALVGITLLAVIIAGIGVSAWLRPAGDHHPTVVAEAATNDKAADAQTATTAQETATAQTNEASASGEATVVNNQSASTSPATATAEVVAEAPKDSPATDKPADAQAAPTQNK